MVRKVKALVSGSNPATQRTIAIKLGISLKTVNTIINQDLKLEKLHKSRVHQLLPRHISERRTNSRKLYENYLAGDRWKFVVTLDEAYVYLSDCNKPRAIYYRPKGEKNFQTWYLECKETFSKGFIIIAGYSYDGKLIIRRVHKNAKVNPAYYQTEVLTPIFRTEVPALYGRDKNRVWVHQDKASSHTSRSTLAFLENMEQETGVHVIPFNNIPVKSPDASPMDFCAIGL
ncbi:transposase, partial [Lasius niger]